MGSLGGKLGKGNWADPTGLIQKSGASKILDPLGLTKSATEGESAADKQLRLEQERQAKITEGISAVNAAFDSPQRAAQIADLVAANNELYQNEANRQQADAARKTKFAEARSGLTGSRQSVDNATDLGEAYQKALVQGTRLAQGKGAALEQADDAARANLIALVQSGLDSTTAGSRAVAAQKSALDASRTASNESELGDAFGGLADIWKNSQTRADERRALTQLQQLYGGGARFGYGGITT